MRFYKVVSDQYLLSIGVGMAGEEITEIEYTNILTAIQNKPTPPDGFDYRLTNSLEWDLYELLLVDPDGSSEIESE